ncbi:hypothetical protein ScPMuIL_008601 [Solemya velum]
MAYTVQQEDPLQQTEMTIYTNEAPIVATTSHDHGDGTQKCFLLEKLKIMKSQGQYCDVVLDVKGVRFFAHKNVLASWSPYFDTQMSSSTSRPGEKDSIVVNYDNFEVFGDMLDFMYSGSIAPRETNFLQLLHLAVSFQIELLKNYCEEFLRCNLHLGNFVSTYFLSRKYHLQSLEEYVVSFLQLNLSDAVKQLEFLALTASKFNAFLSNGWMEQIKPEIKLFLIISWVGYDVRDRECYLVLLLGHIDWSTVASDFLLEISRTENFFTSHESSLYLLLQTLYSSGISLGPYTDLFPTLRNRHSHLLEQVVQTSLIPPEVDDYFPVTILATCSVPVMRDASVSTTLDEGPNNSTVEADLLTDAQNTNSSSIDMIPDTQQSTYEYLTESTCTSKITVDEQPEITFPEPPHERSRESPDLSLAKEASINDSTIENPGTNNVVVKEGIIIGEPKKLRPKKYSRKKNDSQSKTSVVTRKGRTKINTVPVAEQSDDKTEKSEVIGIRTRSERTTLKLSKVKEELSNTENVFDTAEQIADENKNGDSLVEDKDTDYVLENESDEPDYNADSEAVESDIKSKIKKIGSLPRGVKRGRPPKGCAKPRFKCPDCLYIGPNAHRLARHIERAHENKTGNKCNICKFECGWSKEFYRHMKTHFEGPPYKCDNPGCTYKSDKVQPLVVHRMKHSDERPYGCDQCGMRFRTRNNLYAHIKYHSGEKPFECPVCHRCFATKNTMEQHLVTHSSDRPFLCDKCGFSTKYQSHLISHKRIHSGDVFHCKFPKCSYFTPKKSQLKAHMRSHLGVRSHTCNTCGKAFVEKSHLVRHAKIHLDARPYKCEFDDCDYGTTRPDKLKDHIKKHHGDTASAKMPYRARKSRRQLSDIISGTADSPTVETFDHAGYTLQPPTETVVLNNEQFTCIRAQLTSPDSMEQVTLPITIEQRSLQDVVLTQQAEITLANRSADLLNAGGVATLGSGHIIDSDRNTSVSVVSSIAAEQPIYTVQTLSNTPTPVSQTGQSQEYNNALGAFMALF